MKSVASSATALDAIHALCTIPEVFAGDLRNPPNPDDDPATYNYYRKLFALRKDFPELARGELLLQEVECDNPVVFTALRRLDEKTVLIVISLSDQGENARITITTPSGNCKETERQIVNLHDTITGEAIETSGEALELKMKPFQVLTGVFDLKSGNRCNQVPTVG